MPVPSSSSISPSVSGFPIFSSPEAHPLPNRPAPHMAHSRFHPRMSSLITPPSSSLYFRAFHPRRRQVTNSNHFQGRLVHPQHMSQASKDFNSSLPSQTLCHPPQCMSKKTPRPEIHSSHISSIIPLPAVPWSPVGTLTQYFFADSSFT
jgi:hypothetical protein